MILVSEKTAEEKLTDALAALRRIGSLCKWVGWLEAGRAAEAGGRNMREIKRIAEEQTGYAFDEFT